MNVSLLTPALIGHLDAADAVGLIVTLVIVGYLLYALLRGERL
jgi:K+-transporting ATPase KdpF subunit